MNLFFCDFFVKEILAKALKLKVLKCIEKEGRFIDLSENNLMWNNGFAGDPDEGGQREMAVAYLARWAGPVLESHDPYLSPQKTGLPPAYHVQAEGWQAWKNNGAVSGTQGQGLRLEGIEIKVVEKGGVAPGPTGKAFVEKND